MKKRGILAMLILSGAVAIGVSSKTPVVQRTKTSDNILLANHISNLNGKKNSEKTTIATTENSNQNLSNQEIQTLKTKTVEKDGMKFSGLKAMKIAPDMQGSMFLATPGFDGDGFASSVNEQLYNYELNLKNDQKSMAEAINLHDGNPVDTCVFFQSSSLRAIGQAVPDSIGYTTYLENWLANNGWTKHTNFAYIQKGDLCFASYYHTFLFMGWKDKARGIAWVMGNESFVQPYYRRRNLNGKSPAIYGDNSYTGATVYWTYGQGYQGPQTVSNPIHIGAYNAIGITTVESATPLYQNQGSGTIYTWVPTNTKVPVIENSNGWYEVYYEGNYGWINPSNASAIAESMGGGSGAANSLTGSNVGGPYKNIQSTKEPSIGTGVVTASSGLWLNSEPNTNSQQIEIMPEAANVSIIEQQGNWYKVQYYGQVGWAYASYIQAMLSPNNPSPAAQAPEGSDVTQKNKVLNGTTTVTVDLLLNNEPATTSQGATSLATIPEGTTVKVIGESANGWYKAIYNGQTGYILPSYTTGYKATQNLPQPISNKNGIVKENGTLSIYKDGQVQTGWISYNGQTYYANQNGQLLTGWNYVDGDTYYFSPNANGQMLTGWEYINGYWRYLGVGGNRHTGWQDINGKWYHFDQNGAMYEGFVNHNGYVYYTDWLHRDLTGIINVGNGQNYYMSQDGILQVGFENVNGNTYYFNPNTGLMNTGWLWLNNNSYYFNQEGQMLTGWQWIDSYWRYFNNEGVIQKGWQNIDGKWYHLDQNGAMYEGFVNYNGYVYYTNWLHKDLTGFITVNGQNYYMSPEGILQAGTFSVNGKSYTTNNNGALI